MSEKRKGLAWTCVAALPGCYLIARGLSTMYDTYGDKGWGFIPAGASEIVAVFFIWWISTKKSP